MKKLILVLGLAVAFSACSRQDAIEIPTGSDVTLTREGGVEIEGRLVEVKAEHVVIEGRDGVPMTVPRAQIVELRSRPPQSAAAARGGDPTMAAADESASGAPPEAEEPASADERAAVEGERESSATPAPRYREVTLPAGTVLPVTLRTSVASDTSQIEDQVRATIRRTVAAGGIPALPAGTVLTGHVTDAKRSARVKGRGQVAFRFTRADLPGEGRQMTIRTAPVSRVAPGTKKRDAATIGGGAVGGAIIGGIVGGADGAAKGAAIGGAGGTGAVLATRGAEVRVPAGTHISVRLTAPLTIRVAR